MQFVDDSVLGRFDLFDQAFIVRNNWGGVERYRNLPTLHTRLSTACVRKAQKDPDVAPYLPDTIHNDPIVVAFDRKGAKLYEKIKTDLLYDLQEAQDLFGGSFNIMSHYGLEAKFGGPEDEMRGKIMSKIGALKMLCSHPDLLRTSSQKFKQLNGEGSAYANELFESGMLDDVKVSNKLEMMTEYALDFLDQNDNNKVVIFASYVDMLDKIAEKLGVERCRLYSGKLDAKTKEENKIAFNEDSSVRVLISSDAGGYGVDLPAANLLINYDLPWSSGAAAQRNGRIKRASSTWEVIVIQDFIMGGSIESRQHEMLQQKNAVANAVIDGEGIDDNTPPPPPVPTDIL
jgi:SNF2 family DNA or RNA helicase